MPDSVLKFELDKPNEPSDEQRSYEIASRMLFLSARWIKNFCSVHDIDVDAQIEFMLNTWGKYDRKYDYYDSDLSFTLIMKIIKFVFD